MPPKTDPTLPHSTRSIPKATLVSFSLPTEPPTPNGPDLRAQSHRGDAVIKMGFVRQLALQSGEVSAVQSILDSVATEGVPEPHSLSNSSRLTPWDVLAKFEDASMPSLLPPASAFAAVPASELISFGRALLTLRKRDLDQASALPARETSVNNSETQGFLTYLVQAAAVATEGLYQNTYGKATLPIGMLNLERLDMCPAGITRGELLATIPLAPREETAVVQKEWSVTTKEFTSIVSDSLEGFSETGVTDNTELAQSTESQLQHANQFNITGTISGGIPIISGSSTSSFSAQDSSSVSATESRKHAQSATQKASTRSKQEHKVSISTTTATGTSETTTRTLRNPGDTPMRIDYFSLMRKWRVRLYRYGLRLTYDLVIPEPGGALRKAYAELAKLRLKVGTFTFNVTHGEIDPDNTHYLDLANTYQASVPSPPPNLPPLKTNTNFHGNPGWHLTPLELDVPDGYQIDKVHVFADFHSAGGAGIMMVIEDTSPLFVRDSTTGLTNAGGIVDADVPGLLVGETGKQTVTINFVECDVVFVELTAFLTRTSASIDNWRNQVWNALYTGAQTQYYTAQQDIANRVAQLQDQLNGVDPLTLRREESEEIMKGVLRFMLGWGFDFMPQPLALYLQASSPDYKYGVVFTGDDSLLANPVVTSVTSTYENMVRFINQAIEWENVVTFMYSYFWDVPGSWDFIRQIQHPDATRQAFLRAGSARVVLTVRKGWEEAWSNFVATGDPSTPSPYLSIAKEIAAYDDRFYPGVPAANNGKMPGELEDSVYTVSTSSVTSGPGAVLKVESTDGFVVGRPIVVDSGANQESAMVTALAANTITVDVFSFAHAAGIVAFQPGDKGTLIAEWFEYTPTSGTDIGVTTDLAEMA